ncbi:N-6 DNA methylase, partial [Leuconostoc mesenteroides]|uniref:HsdM family class I SAM-dependent methyltransferase n=3 Tax=Lactobacillaceae TaxID=33958 RepID=UPI001CBE4A68
MVQLTEDVVRQQASEILGLNIKQKNAISGSGQITTFNQLGFKGISDKPDGWYLPNDLGAVAFILETKSNSTDISKKRWADELLKNVAIVGTKYSKVIGVLWNGKDIRVFKNDLEISIPDTGLNSIEFYTKLFTNVKLNKQHIYEVTQKINNSLHFEFGVTDLQERMIFTACALVAQRYNPQNGLQRLKGMGYNAFKNWIFDAIAKAVENDKKQNAKLDVLLEEYSYIRISITENQEAIDGFIDSICDISDLVNSDNWRGEDVMAIFFNEFSRFRGKADAGQVFTPDHVTSFMYRLINISYKDKVLDATCGSGAFLVKAMSNMIQEVGGVNAKQTSKIKKEHLFGIEMYRRVFALACANMMIHKDGKSNLQQLDAKSEEAGHWIANKGITKVLMNPPYERKYKFMKILENVFENIPRGTLCAIILPDTKLDKNNGQKLLKKHTLKTIVKMPDNLFFGIGVKTSIFIFEANVPQNGKNIIGYRVEDDGLVTVKNQGRHDLYNKWDQIENYWVKAIQDGNDYLYNTRQIINPNDRLSYKVPSKIIDLHKEDFQKVLVNYTLFENSIDTKTLVDKITSKILYDSKFVKKENFVSFSIGT